MAIKIQLISIFVIWFLVSLHFKFGITTSCTSGQCFLNTSELDPHISCSEAPFGTSVGQCYGTWSSLSSCSCGSNTYRISSSGATYWCDSSDNWDPALYSLQCFASCNININAHVIARNPSGEVVTSIQDGDYAELSCDDGYTGRGTAHVTCSDGTLDTTEPFVCFESCYLPDNYEFKDESLTEPVEDGLHVDIRCADNFPQTFTIKRSCNNGSFGTLPPCSKPCSLPSLDGTNLMSDATGDVVENGTVVTYSCHDDYNLNGTDDVLCLYGDLIPPDLPQCIAKPCSLPPLDGTNLMSDATGDVVENGTVVTYSCHDDYNLNGTDDVLCLYGGLIPPELPQCIAASCLQQTFVDDHVMIQPNQTVYESGTKVRYYCPGALTLLGDEYSTCSYGSWNISTEPTCQASFCDTPNPDDTIVKITPNSTEYQHDETVTYSCPSGYDLKGNSTALCQFGVWEIEYDPTCEPSSCGNPSPNDTRVVLLPNRIEYQHNETVEFSCPSGYDLIGNTGALCQYSVWDIVYDPTCEPASCLQQTFVDEHVMIQPNQTVYESGTKVRYYCPEAFSLLGDEYSTCSYGNWTILTEPSCQACDGATQCPLFQSRLDPNVSCTASTYGETNPPCFGHWSSLASCQCDDPNQRLSQSGRTYWCGSGSTWDEDLYNLKCLEPCSISPDLNIIAQDSHGVESDTFMDSEGVYLSCPEGYLPDGTASMTCKDGNWDPPLSFQCYEVAQ